ncbi:MAG: T9SS type A sorting domain-containing protein [Flavobacteriales bacterium]|nr:T9SS type A sorting domain-containing protein [Flavobacteriales bacterium]
MTDFMGHLLLDLSTSPFGDTIQWFTDTIHADYAFIITLDDFVKSRTVDDLIVLRPEPDWDFTVFPNPSRQDVFLRFHREEPKDIILLDMAGRRIATHTSITSSMLRLTISELAKGPYFIRVTCGDQSKTKKLIIH